MFDKSYNWQMLNLTKNFSNKTQTIIRYIEINR